MAGLMVTKRDIQRAEAYLSRRDPAKSSTAAKYVEPLLANATIGGVSFAMGLAKGKYGPMSLGPVPYDLLGFGLFTAAGLYFSSSKASKHLLNVGNGLWAGYTHTLGMGIGASLGKGQPLRTQPVISGTGVRGQFQASNAPLSEAELRAMAQAVR